MAWTAPRTWVTGEIVTAAMLNVHVRDNTIDLDRRTSPIAAYSGPLSEVTSVSFVDVTNAPSVVVTIGTNGKALVSLYADVANSGTEASLMSHRVAGATTVAASDDTAIAFTPGVANTGARIGNTILRGGLNSGSNTFIIQGRTTGATTAKFRDMRIAVTPLGS